MDDRLWIMRNCELRSRKKKLVMLVTNKKSNILQFFRPEWVMKDEILERLPLIVDIDVKQDVSHYLEAWLMSLGSDVFPANREDRIQWLRTRADRACPLRHRAELVRITLPALICIFIIQIALVYQPCLAAGWLRCGFWINLNFWHNPSRVSDYLFAVWLTNQRFYLCLIRARAFLLSQSSSCFRNDCDAK